VPELPEVQALADFLAERAVGRAVSAVQLGSVSALKTYQPPLAAITGSVVTGVARYGKFLSLRCGEVYLVVHLARHGWLQWRESLPRGVLRLGGPVALRVALDGPGFDLTEGTGRPSRGSGTHKRLAVYLVTDPSEVPGVATLGIDPFDPVFTVAALADLLRGERGQLKGVLRDQGRIAGIGNAYSDEILHAARLSPFRPAGNLSEAEVAHLHAAIGAVLGAALQRAAGTAAAELKGEKRSGLRVHGRAGQPCPECGDVIRSVSFADSSLEYCPTCQTGGTVLADRRLSRLLK
jgi:formamidopyrimidine-DNA glycosylase